MITEIEFTNHEAVFYSENLPIDFKKDDFVFLKDLKHFFKKGRFYHPDFEENKRLTELNTEDIHVFVVKSVSYGFFNNKIVKILEAQKL